MGQLVPLYASGQPVHTIASPHPNGIASMDVTPDGRAGYVILTGNHHVILQSIHVILQSKHGSIDDESQYRLCN
jgi:hypothetical protein